MRNGDTCSCGGAYALRLVTHTVGGITIDDVPEGVCQSCGSESYSADTVERIEALAFGLSPDAVSSRWARAMHAVN